MPRADQLFEEDEDFFLIMTHILLTAWCIKKK